MPENTFYTCLCLNSFFFRIVVVVVDKRKFPHQQSADGGVWQMTLMCVRLMCCKGLHQWQAVLRHREHRKQLWIIRVQLSWPYAEALETWSSGTSLWVERGWPLPHFSWIFRRTRTHAFVWLIKLLVGRGRHKPLWSFLNPSVSRIDWKCKEEKNLVVSRASLGWNLHKNIRIVYLISY